MPWIIRGVLLIAVIGTSVSARAQERDTLLPHTSDGYGYESVVPEGWVDAGQGIFARQRDAEDPTLIAQQSGPVSATAVLTSLLPQLRLPEAPGSVGMHHGEVLDWTLYQVNMAKGNGDVAVDLALAEAEDTTYIVLLQSAPDESEALHESVFLPALNIFAPLVETIEAVPYRVEDVTFVNGGVTLASTLTLPPSDGPHPVIVLVSGSGPQDRDESLGRGIAIKPFRLLADALTREGWLCCATTIAALAIRRGRFLLPRCLISRVMPRRRLTTYSPVTRTIPGRSVCSDTVKARWSPRCSAPATTTSTSSSGWRVPV